MLFWTANLYLFVYKTYSAGLGFLRNGMESSLEEALVPTCANPSAYKSVYFKEAR